MKWRGVVVAGAFIAAALAGAAVLPRHSAGRAGVASGPIRSSTAAGTTTSAVETTTTVPPEPPAPPTSAPTPVNVPAGQLATVISHLRVNGPVVFVTIDDGYVRDPQVLDLIRAQHIPVALFLIGRVAPVGADYFHALQAAGATIEDHTNLHPKMPGLTFDDQKNEICTVVPEFTRLFGARPALFRPPYGLYDDATRRAAADCGFRALVEWSASMNGGQLATASGGPLVAGDIVLMHFRPDLYANLTALLRIVHDRGLQFGRLESYLSAS